MGKFESQLRQGYDYWGLKLRNKIYSNGTNMHNTSFSICSLHFVLLKWPWIGGPIATLRSQASCGAGEFFVWRRDEAGRAIEVSIEIKPDITDMTYVGVSMGVQ